MEIAIFDQEREQGRLRGSNEGAKGRPDTDRAYMPTVMKMGVAPGSLEILFWLFCNEPTTPRRIMLRYQTNMEDAKEWIQK